MRVMRRGILAAGAALLLAAACQSTPATVDPSASSLVMGDAKTLGFDPAKLDAITTALNADIASGKLPGAYLLIGRHGQVAYEHGFGVQGPGQTTPTSNETIFRVFSMTKPIVSVTAMTLVAGRQARSRRASLEIPAGLRQHQGLAKRW